MKKFGPLALAIVFFLNLSCQSQTEQKKEEVSSGKGVGLQLITDELTLPTAFAVTSHSPELLFVTEQEGRIRVIQDGQLRQAPFLDITNEVLKKDGYDERGLLGLAFHPNYASNGLFYVYCSVEAKGANHRSEVREYKVQAGNPLVADKASKRVVLEFDQPEGNHNGGELKFGNDGFLYIGVGDGGGAGDKHGTIGNAQDRSNLLGKILRIDVNQKPYGIPSDNPFVSEKNVRPEIYAYGLRNPWRFSFDKADQRLFAGDVGQNKYEEIDIIEKGGNYGWRALEGFQVFNDKDPQPKNPIDPIFEYPHSEGISITGGYVYRGKSIPHLAGSYIYGDMSGPIWKLSQGADKKWTSEKMEISKSTGYWHVYSFGEDLDGELYVLVRILGDAKGAVYKLIP
ncbi:PQQ-dependent sugar dehydrogenase [Dyadobacter tibetensis]|uniref:PQQ-dependent sugar dehydrogenase n=1 Tax=Dyadobacter tibetensis TaxID=1211851 RepID=UPI000471409D|nr:PQQ-dependent sugar dehydrogenase [Dyadobacter tibetensis]